MSRFGTFELSMLGIMNLSNEQRRRCCVRVKAWKVKPAPNDYYSYHPQPAWDWRLPQVPTITTPNTSGGYVPVTSSGDVPIVPMHGVIL